MPRLLLVLTGLTCVGAGNGYAASGNEHPLVQATDPWNAADLIDPTALAHTLAAPAAEKPTVLCVGVASLYHGAHIVGARYAGPASTTEGLQALQNAVRDLPHDQPLAIYCGCCPWEDCPNIRPAYALLHRLGFRHVRVLAIPQNFHHDWVDRGFPVEKGGKAS